jgi:hypothetical protein
MQTKHGLKTKTGILEKKVEKLEAQLNVEPKSASGESLKESVRMLVSLVIGSGVTYLYQRYPILGELQPDQATLVVVITSLVVRALDKYIYQFQKNHGKALKGVGIDLIFSTLGNLMKRKKTVIKEQKLDV